MEKLDLTKKYKSYYSAKTKPELIQVEPAQFISICGKGDPNDKPFAERIEALYTTAYNIKFSSKAKNKDFVVSKLEGLWWYDEKRFPGKSIKTATEVPRSEWEYRLLIRLPEFITKQELDDAIEIVMDKKNLQLAKQIDFFFMTEGKCVQMLHIGPYSTEPESLQKMGAFMEENKLTKNGHHHEIYLSDFRKTTAEKLKTILREPVM